VGTEFGTVTVVKAELCRTASPYAHMPVAAASSEKKNGTDNADDKNSGHDTAGKGDVKIPKSTSEKLNGDKDKEENKDKAMAEQEKTKMERAIEAAW
jgi:hypothetical protein